MKIGTILKNPFLIIEYLASNGKLNWLNDKAYLSLLYRARVGKKLHLKTPESFNEKIQWLKLYDRNPRYVSLVDKSTAKDIVGDSIGHEYIIPTIGIYNSFSEIDFNVLPNQFVIKCTHDSGGYVICKNKNMFDVSAAREKITGALAKNYYWNGREWPYKEINPRIIIEKYMKDDKSDNLTDYKFMCFNGKVKCIFTCTERFADTGLKVTFFDENWEKLPFERHYKSSSEIIARPAKLEKMIQLAEMLSENIPFVRVDFYEINEAIYFGEMTFFPGNGFEEFRPDEWDNILGKWIVLPDR